jgi:hypothetical protein
MKNFDQNNLNERNLLKFDPNKLYYRANLEQSYILNRALRLLFQARFGQETSHWKISPYINYSHLPDRIIKAIERLFQFNRYKIKLI